MTVPGFTELDLVAHGGDRADGEFAHSLNVTDIHTTWGETRAVLGRGEARVQTALEEIRQALPFRLQGIDSDNGSEFINDHLYRYCQAQGIQFTRGRPYKKDDNAHIEQKNWTHVRKLVGYLRYDTPLAVGALNALYRHELRLFQNLFLPVRQARAAKSASAPDSGGGTTRRGPRSTACTRAPPPIRRRSRRGSRSGISSIPSRSPRRSTARSNAWSRWPPSPDLGAAPPRAGTMAALERVVQCRRPPPPRHLTTPFDYGNRLRRPKGRPSRVTS